MKNNFREEIDDDEFELNENGDTDEHFINMQKN